VGVPPVPLQSKFSEGGVITPPWVDWLNKVFIATKNLSTSGGTSPAVIAPTIVGSYAFPISIVAATGIGVGADSVNEIRYVVGDGGAVDITANPKVEVGSTDGQLLRLIGTSDTNTVKLDNGTGLLLNGSCTLGDRGCLTLLWDNGQSVWMEISRNDMA